MDIGEPEKVHEIEPGKIDVAPEEVPDDLPDLEPVEPESDPEPEKVPA